MRDETGVGAVGRSALDSGVSCISMSSLSLAHVSPVPAKQSQRNRAFSYPSFPLPLHSYMGLMRGLVSLGMGVNTRL